MGTGACRSGKCCDLNRCPARSRSGPKFPRTWGHSASGISRVCLDLFAAMSFGIGLRRDRSFLCNCRKGCGSLCRELADWSWTVRGSDNLFSSTTQRCLSSLNGQRGPFGWLFFSGRETVYNQKSRLGSWQSHLIVRPLRSHMSIARVNSGLALTKTTCLGSCQTWSG